MKLRHLIFTTTILLLATAGVFAHPLGNFSVNQYSKLQPGKSVVAIRQVLDLAEIPTFQESAAIDTNKDGTLSDDELQVYLKQITPGYLANLKLSVNGIDSAIRVVKVAITVNAGDGGLQTLRVEWDLAADVAAEAPENKLTFRNDNYPERIGWREIVAERGAGVEIYNSTAYGSGVTDELKAYPQASLAAPLDERAAEFAFSLGTVPAGAKRLQNRDGLSTTPVQKDKLAELIAVKEVTPLVILAGLFIAFGLGALHAMSPGHGKTVVGAYLVGSKGTAKHAVFLGLVVTITHTLGVFAIGLITLFASNYILPERLIPFLSFISGLLVFFIGISLFKDRLFGAFGWKGSHHDHGHEHPHEHDGHSHTHGGSTHTHLPPKDISLKSLLGLGISGGLLPCPSALVLMLSAISLGRVGYGLVLTLVFSLGLATTLTAVGLIFLYVGKAFGSTSLSQNRVFKALPVLSALVIACVGAVICYGSLG